MMRLYSVYDSCSNVWNPVCTARNDDEAMRGFHLSCCDPNIPEGFLSDIAIYHVGDFDELTGAIIPCEPVMIIRGNNYKVLSDREAIRRNCFGGNTYEMAAEEN